VHPRVRLGVARMDGSNVCSPRRRFPGKSTCVVITEIEPRWFAAWRGYKSGKRPADYKVRCRNARLLVHVLLVGVETSGLWH